MINLLINKLKGFNEIKDYRIIHNKEKRNEIYYIGDKVETVRDVNISSTYNVTVYCDFNDQRGFANFTVFSSNTNEEIDSKIKDAITRTKFSKNKYFDLPKGEYKVFGSSLDKHDPSLVFKIGDTIIDAAKGYDDGWLSSFEVFINQKEVNIVNSKGVNYTYFTNSIFLEIIPTFRKDGYEIELYNALDYEDVDLENIRKDVIILMRNADLRNNSINYNGPKEIPVILEAKEIKEIISNLIGNFDYYSVYNNMNMLKLNDLFYGENPLDAPNISLTPYITNSVNNVPVDKDGIILEDTDIVLNNKIISYHGDNTFGYYLNEDKPTGLLPNIYIEDGTFKEAELHEKPYLKCLSFSSFQFDIYSGNFGGEVRLALYFDGSSLLPVSGITISGNIHELKSHLKFSEVRRNISGYSGPKHVLIESMNVN